MDIPDLGSDLLSVGVRSAIIYVFLVIALRIAGKREISQMSTPDLVVLLVVANGAQNAMVGENTSVLGGVVACVTILVVARGVERLTASSRTISNILIGEPRILIRDGQRLEAAILAEEISDEELMAALREHGVESVDKVHLAVLEVDGSISVLPVNSADAAGSGPGARIAGHLPRQVRRIGRRGREAGAG